MTREVCYFCHMDRELDFEEAAALTPAVQKHVQKAPWHLAPLAIAALGWSLLGVFDLLAILTRFGPYMSQMPEMTREFVYGLPLWVLALRALAVFASLAGAVMLLRRQIAAVRMLALAATLTILSIGASFTGRVPDDPSVPAFAACIIVVAIVLLYYAQTWARRGVLK